MLIKNIALSCRTPRERLLAAFERYGVEPSRIECHGRVKSQSGHLEFFSRVDICLDSFPYNGTTTNCDSLVMGVPVICLRGDDHRSRVGASQLTHLGMEQWIADDEEAYVRLASSLAADHAAIADWRKRLRERMAESPLMQAEDLVRHLERTFGEIWSAEQE